MAKIRCTRCNRYGTDELNGLCKSCSSKKDSETRFYEEIWKFNKYPSLVKGALLEVGVTEARQVKPEDRQKVLRIIERRNPKANRRYIVQDESPMCGSHNPIVSEKYGIEKERFDIEHY